MRTGLLLGAALALLAPAAVSAADPPIVYQTQPLGRLLDESRTAAAHLGGDKAVMAFNEEIKKTLGEKGFEGLDINRPIVGYINLPADPANTVVVLALPVTGEKEFVAFCERWNLGNKPKPLPGGLYELPALGPPLKALMRIADGYAYIATSAADPTPALDPKALVPAAKLFDLNERALATGRVYFDRIPPEVRAKAADYLKEAAKNFNLGAAPPGLGIFGQDAFEQLVKLANRYLELSKDAKEAALRLFLDPGTADLSVELTLSANPGTPLDKVISGKRPTANKFNGLLTPDTAAGFKTRLPFFNDELRDTGVKGLENLQKLAVNAGPAKDFLDEVLKGLIRTVRTGEVDIAAGLRGPDKAGLFTGVLAIAFEDPTGVEKEFKKLIDDQAPPEIKAAFKWDAAKAGNVSIHTLDVAKAGGGLGFGGENMKRAFGDNATLAFAFAPKAIFLALGPDSIATMKDLVALKPAPSPVLDIVLNASRLGKFALAIDGEQAAATLAEVLGKEDKLVSAASLAITGGKELKVTFAINLRLLPRAFLYTAIREVKNEAVPGARK